MDLADIRFRSGLERQVARQITLAGHQLRYEDTQIKYLRPAKPSTYTPDFVLPNGIIVETKGRFLTEDRQKTLLVREQHPDLELRFVFSNSNTKIGKGSPTTYAMWCESKGFKYANKFIPHEWFEEVLEVRCVEALERLHQGQVTKRRSR